MLGASVVLVNMRIWLQATGLRNGFRCLFAAVVFQSSLLIFPQGAVASELMQEALPGVVPADVIYNGSFAQRIEFKVPEQRGLEPRLGLSYDSGRANAYGPDSVVGAGWRITGLSSIQRANPRRAVPRFNSADVWLLDGQELVACGSYDKAGCGAGGTHATWVETYQRIKQIADDNTWEITARDGTRYIYKAVGTWIGTATIPVSGSRATNMLEQYRYLLAEKVNTKGQAVSYDYVCANDLDCRIASVSYGIGEVVFHWEARPDSISYAVGRMLAKSTQRLRTVEVRSAGEMLRTYDLAYNASPATNRSLLVSVTERGRDSVIENGVVTAGTALPAYTFQYSGAAPDPVQVADVSAESALFTKPSHWIGPVAVGKFGDDNKVYGIYCDQGNFGTNDFKTSEPNQREVIRNMACNFNPRFYFIKNTHSRKKNIVYYSHSSLCSYSPCPATTRYDSTYGRPRLIADFDGDGLEDITGADNSPVQQRYTASWSANSWGGYGEGGNFAADLNGDGLVDIYDPESGHIEFHLSNGTNSFSHAYNHSLSPFFGSYRLIGDYNGDGSADFLIANNSGNSYRIYYTVGEGVVSGPSFSLPESCPSTCIRPTLAGDLDSDGLQDLVVKISSTKSLVYLNRGGSFQPLTRDGSDFYFPGDYIGVGDVDDDGLDEVVKRSDYKIAGFGAERWSLFAERPDLLNFVRSPLGAETRVAYERHVPETQTDMPLALFVVTSLETFDGRSVYAKTDYAYSGARWAWRERRFLGFEKIVATLPQNAGETNRPIVETTYMQDFASVGKVSEVVRKDGDGTLLQKRAETYDVQTSALPYWSRNTETVTTDYLEGTAREKRETREYNDYGLVVRTVSHGDVSTTDGERDLVRQYYPNTEKYIVNRRATETVNALASDGSPEQQMWKRWYFYDGVNDTETQPPVEGYRTQTSEWTGFGTGTKVAQLVASYDVFGNMTSEANGFGDTTRYVYDGTYSLFPEEVRNPRYGADSRQKKTLTWDRVCGVVLSETDESGAVTSHVYDTLCRKTRTDLPGGGRVSYDYENWGNPVASRNRTRTLHPNGAGEVTQEMYFDGFGRTYLEETSTTKQTASADPGTIDTTAYNTPHVANPIPDQSLTQDVLWQYTVPANTFVDGNGDALVYSARQTNGRALPSWLSFDSASRTFAGTAPAGLIETTSVSVLASDGTGVGEDIFKLAVLTPNAPTVANALSDLSVATDEAWSFTVPEETFEDADQQTLTLSASLASGAPLPTWLRFDEGTRTFTSTPPNRPVAIKVTASDGAASVSQTFDLSTSVIQTRVELNWGIRAYLSRGILTMATDTQTVTHDRRRNQNPYWIGISGGNARIVSLNSSDGKVCKFTYIDQYEEREKLHSPNGSTSVTDWSAVETRERGISICPGADSTDL